MGSIVRIVNQFEDGQNIHNLSGKPLFKLNCICSREDAQFPTVAGGLTAANRVFQVEGLLRENPNRVLVFIPNPNWRRLPPIGRAPACRSARY